MTRHERLSYNRILSFLIYPQLGSGCLALTQDFLKFSVCDAPGIFVTITPHRVILREETNMQEQDAMSLADEDIVALLAMNLNAYYERLVSLSTYHGHSQLVNDVA